MVHTAYDTTELVKGCQARIDAVASHSGKLFLGCSDCSLRIYAPSSLPTDPSSDHEIRRGSYSLERSVNSFWRRAPTAMEVSHTRDLLLSLSEWVAVHRLPSLESLVAIGKTKGANVYSWDDRRGFLSVGRQKRVIIYRLDGGREFVEVKEFSVPDTVRSMAWCGENICLGIRREYMIMNSITGALSDIFPSGRSPPLVVPLPTAELLLGKDNIGVFVDQNGKLRQEGRICWSDTPTTVVIHRPYAVARMPRHIEIRSLRAPNPLVQTVVLRDVNLLLQINNCIVAAQGNSLHGLMPVPIGAQIVQLTASGEFEEALVLCKLLPPEDSSLRASKESSIHMRYGHYLFDNGNYEEAMEQFLASQVDITYILSLYPSLILPKLAHTTVHDKAESTESSSQLSRQSSEASDEMEAGLATQAQLGELDEKETKKMNHNALMALVKYLQKRRSGIVERATVEVTDEVVSGAVHDGLSLSEPYRSKPSAKRRVQTHVSSVARETATVLDTALLQGLVLTNQVKGALDLLKGMNYCDLKICEEFLKERNQYTVLLELYKCNGMHHEALKLLNQLVEETNNELTKKFKPSIILDYLKPLCRSDPMLVLESSLYVLERCPTETIELFLSENVPADLVNSYLKQYAPNLQSTYLELMLSMSETGINPNLQNELVQLYLSEVLDWYNGLKEEQKWDEKELSPTRKKLISTLEVISGYNAENLLKRLPNDALFEERAILLGKINQHHLALSLYVHKLKSPEKAVGYCDRLYDECLNQPAKPNSNIYLTLLQIYLNPRKTAREAQRKVAPVSQMAPKPANSKLRGSRLSKKVVEIEFAEEARFSASGTDSGRSDGDMDELSEDGQSQDQEGSKGIMLNEALDLLSKRWDRINGAQALKLLPRDTRLQNLLSFLEPLLKNSSEHRRNYLVIKNLNSSENLQVKEELYKHRKAVVKIDADSMCSLCHKRMGNSAFAIYPNGKTLVHFVCYRDSQRIKSGRSGSQSRRL
ncbi:Vam6/Vps39-like protein [Rhynchospora pubera]|uniref:Vam6/Vps39-like protein n=1 Tax=Rhynchospora pubera TaxID=906938 RepID=A0AAV8FCM8_9POAL|nr:Vam6/Vps39-like protein [Rhynchospora pubera]